MNERLKKLKDGTGSMSKNEVVWFDTANDGDVIRQQSDFGEVFWPFVLVWDVGSSEKVHLFTVTHLPRGRRMPIDPLPRRAALRMIRECRALGEKTWAFTKITGRSWEACKKAAQPIVNKYRALAKQQAVGVDGGSAKPSTAAVPSKP